MYTLLPKCINAATLATAPGRRGPGSVAVRIPLAAKTHQRQDGAATHGRRASARACRRWLAADVVPHLVGREAHLVPHQRAHRHFERDALGRNRALEPAAVERLDFAVHHEARD